MKKKILTTILLSLLIMATFVGLERQQIPTDNNNASYPWLCSPSYPDTISFTTTNVEVGSCSLMVNHTSATSYMAFSVDIGASTDFSNASYFAFWLYYNGSSATPLTVFMYQSGRFTGNHFTYVVGTAFPINQWFQLYLPMSGFTNFSASWSSIRYIGFRFGPRVANYTTVYIDGLRSEINSQLPFTKDMLTESSANATWFTSPGYPDSISYSADYVLFGSNSLKVNHTSTDTQMEFGTFFTPTNLASCSAVSFSVYVLSSRKVMPLTIEFSDSTALLCGPLYTFSVNLGRSLVTNQWVNFSIPLGIFENSSDLSSWNAIQQVDFIIGGGSLPPSDYTCIFIDGFYVKQNFTYYTASNSVNASVLPNILSYVDQNQVSYRYRGNTYTGLNCMMPLNGGKDKDPEVQSETLAQTIFGLLLAYNYTHYEFLLDQANMYWNWLACYQDQSTGAFYPAYSNTTGFAKSYDSVTVDGWVLVAGSFLYSFTLNSTIKATLDSLINHDTSIMWNSTYNRFNLDYWWRPPVTITYPTVNPQSWAIMKEGAMIAGFGAYYTYVAQNSTVLSCLNAAANSALNVQQSMGISITFGANSNYEDNMYQYWGLYFAYLATGNVTYETTLLNLEPLLFAINEVNQNASMPYDTWNTFSPMQTSQVFDGWGWACSLPLWLEMYLLSPNQHLLNLYEIAVGDTLPQILTSSYSITRMRGNTMWNSFQYTGSNAFIYASLAMYYNIPYPSPEPTQSPSPQPTQLTQPTQSSSQTRQQQSWTGQIWLIFFPAATAVIMIFIVVFRRKLKPAREKYQDALRKMPTSTLPIQTTF